MLVRLRRLGRDDAGQALAEYGIALAMVAGMNFLEGIASRLAGMSTSAMVLSGAVVAVTVYALFARR